MDDNNNVKCYQVAIDVAPVVPYIIPFSLLLRTTSMSAPKTGVKTREMSGKTTATEKFRFISARGPVHGIQILSIFIPQHFSACDPGSRSRTQNGRNGSIHIYRFLKTRSHFAYNA